MKPPFQRYTHRHTHIIFYCFYSFICSFCTRGEAFNAFFSACALQHQQQSCIQHVFKFVPLNTATSRKNIWLYLVFALISIYVYATVLLIRKYVIVCFIFLQLALFLLLLFPFRFSAMAYKHAATIESKSKEMWFQAASRLPRYSS